LQKHQDTKFASGSYSEKAEIFIRFNNKSKVTKATRSYNIALRDVFIFFDFNVHTSIIEVENNI